MKPRNFLVCLILAWLLATTAMHCQTMQEQKACYIQSIKVVANDYTTHMVASNHYDARTKTCWVKEWQLNNGVVMESIFNAFEPNVSEAELDVDQATGASSLGVICFVHDTMCKSIVEFERLAKQRYGF